MNNYGGAPPFIMPQMTPHPPQSMDHPRMGMAPVHHAMQMPPPLHPQSFPRNMKFIHSQPNVHHQTQYYSDDRGAHVYYPPQPIYHQNFSQPPPQHYVHQPYIQPSFEAIAEQLKNQPQPSVVSQTPPNLHQVNHPMTAHLSHQQMGMMHMPLQQPYQQRQHYNQNSRGQTPTTTASHSDSKRSSPQNAADVKSISHQQQREDYTPPGTPQELTPMTEDQKKQYITTMGHVDKGMETVTNKLRDTHVNEFDSQKQEHVNDPEVYDPSKPMEFFNKKFQDRDHKNWQHNVHAGERNMGGNKYDIYNGGRNDRQMKNQPVPSRQGRYSNIHSSQDDGRHGGSQQQRPQRYQQQLPQQQKPRQITEQWRDPPPSTRLDQFVRAPDPERITECTYCRMLGKPVEEYSNHYIREPNGKAVCPEIQKLRCSICNNTREGAHSEYFCPKYEAGDDLEKKIAESLRAFLERRKQQPPLSATQNQSIRSHQHSYYGGRRH